MMVVFPPLIGVVLVAVVCIAMTKSAAAGNILRNAGVGIRTKKTMVSDEAWLAGHQAALPIIRWIGVVAAVCVLAALVVQWQIGGEAGVFIAISGLLIEVVILLFASKAAGEAASEV